MLHAVYRVGDMATTIDYYKKHFGMKLLRYRDIPDVRWALALSCILVQSLPSSMVAAFSALPHWSVLQWQHRDWQVIRCSKMRKCRC